MSSVRGHSPAATRDVANHARRSSISAAVMTYSATDRSFAPVAG